MKRVYAIIILAVLAFFIFKAIDLSYHNQHFPLAQYYISHGMRDTGALNMVTAIYLNYRVYDTLGEATIFFASALGVFMILRKNRGGKSGG